MWRVRDLEWDVYGSSGNEVVMQANRKIYLVIRATRAKREGEKAARVAAIIWSGDCSRS